MSNFLKPINNLPVAESISEGDKILINSSGVAKQIDASLVGGGGGGMTVIYAKYADENEVTVMAYKDADYTQQMTYAEGKKAFENGAIAIMTQDGMPPAALTVLMAQSVGEEAKIYTVITIMNIIQNTDMTAVLFSDSVMD